MVEWGKVMTTGEWVQERLLVVPPRVLACKMRCEQEASQLPGEQVEGVLWWSVAAGLERVMVVVVLEVDVL